MNLFKLVLPGIFMIAVTYGLARFSFGLFLPDISQSLEINSSTAGIVSSLFYVSYCLTIIYSTFYTIRIGPGMMITAAGVSALIGLLAIGMAPNVWILSIGAFLAGSSTGLVSPPFGLAISLWIRAKQQGKANTWINSGTSMGIVFTGLSTTLVPLGWRETYIIYAILTLMIIVWNYIIIPKYNKDLNIYTGSLNFRDIKGSEFVSIASVMLGIATAPF